MEGLYHPGQRIQLTVVYPDSWGPVRLAKQSDVQLVELPLPPKEATESSRNSSKDPLELAAAKLKPAWIQQLASAFPGLPRTDIQAAILLHDRDLDDATDRCKAYYLKRTSQSPSALWKELYGTKPSEDAECSNNLVGAHQAAVLAAEIDEVLQLVERSGGEAFRHKVVKVERVQNPRLWKQYYLKKGELLESGYTEADLNEHRVFHGTSNSTADIFSKEGFDFRVTMNAAYGNGAYFTDSCSTALSCSQHKQAPYYGSHSTDLKLLVAKVLQGKQCGGLRGMVRPPAGFDSVHSGLRGSLATASGANNAQQQYPYWHVVFDNHQTYPEYILTMK